jgi:hypothetical protein
LSVPRKHHFVPVFYQKRWAGKDGKLFVYTRPIDRKIIVQECGPGAKGWQEELYSMPDAGRELEQALEAKFLNRVDELAASALRKMLQHGTRSLNNDERSAWSRYVINALIRNPDAFEELRRRIDLHWKAPNGETEAEYRKLRSESMPATFQQWVDLQGAKLRGKIRLQLLHALLDNDKLGSRLNNMIWRLIDLSKADYRLLTSDNPVVRHLNGQSIIFAMPVSPTMLFVAANQVNLVQELQMRTPMALVKDANLDIVRRARKFVFSNDNSQTTFVINHMSTRLEEKPFYSART